jgi:hypothetical protein
MKYLSLSVCLLLLLVPQLVQADAHRAWFSDCYIDGCAQMNTPSLNPYSSAVGTVGDGINLTVSRPPAITNPMLKQQNGTLSFWLMPSWNGNDGKKHIILKIGKPESDGIIIEKSSANTLRFVMAGGGKVTACRTDVSNWKANEWHHIQASWIDKSDKSGSPLGLALWIDRVCVVSAIHSGTAFAALSPNSNIYLGGPTAKARMDELIFRNEAGTTRIAYRDYFRTAPYTAIKITYNPNRLPDSTDANTFAHAETRVLEGYDKHFGIIATKVINGVTGTTRPEYITNFDARYGQWTEFDAKPFITWTIDDTDKATVNENCLVHGVKAGTTTLTASLRRRTDGKSALTDSYPLTVISPANLPDLSVMYVERFPKYNRDGTNMWVYGGSPDSPSPNNGKLHPAAGDTVTSVVHYANFGFAAANNVTLKLEVLYDTNNNMRRDASERVCTHHWDAEASLPDRDRDVALTLGPGRVEASGVEVFR